MFLQTHFNIKNQEGEIFNMRLIIKSDLWDSRI